MDSGGFSNLMSIDFETHGVLDAANAEQDPRQALKDHDLACCGRPRLAGPRDLSYNCLDISFSPFNDYWKDIRKLSVQELFSTKKIHSIQPIKDEEVKKLINSLTESAPKKTPVNLNQKFLTLTTSVLCRVAFSIRHRGRTRRNEAEIIYWMDNVLLAGIDTSSITMTWAMAELARNPRAMKKVQSEIRNQMGKRSVISLDDIDQLKYLKMVIKETWRLHPPAPLLVPKEVISEFEVNGYMIQPKTLLHVKVWAIGRDPGTWKDPEMFLPERFIGSNIDTKGQNFELLPFGGGRRICPAMYMGTTMVECGLANMLYNFDWELPEDMMVEDLDMEEAPGLTVSKINELLLVPVEYLDH
ncbi:hypothetical protein Bca101_048957 [Brassica carinata]